MRNRPRGRALSRSRLRDAVSGRISAPQLLAYCDAATMNAVPGSISRMNISTLLSSSMAVSTVVKPALRGVTVHDVRGLECGLPPGEGEIDWGSVLPTLSPGLPIVLRPRSGCAPERIAAGLDRLRRGLAGDENTPADPFLL